MAVRIESLEADNPQIALKAIKELDIPYEGVLIQLVAGGIPEVSKNGSTVRFYESLCTEHTPQIMPYSIKEYESVPKERYVITPRFKTIYPGVSRLISNDQTTDDSDLYVGFRNTKGGTASQFREGERAGKIAHVVRGDLTKSDFEEFMSEYAKKPTEGIKFRDGYVLDQLMLVAKSTRQQWHDEHHADPKALLFFLYSRNELPLYYWGRRIDVRGLAFVAADPCPPEDYQAGFKAFNNFALRQTNDYSRIQARYFPN